MVKVCGWGRVEMIHIRELKEGGGSGCVGYYERLGRVE
jgi:hypothetical protein